MEQRTEAINNLIEDDTMAKPTKAASIDDMTQLLSLSPNLQAHVDLETWLHIQINLAQLSFAFSSNKY